MTIELPEQLEVALTQKASVRGLSPDAYILGLLKRDVEEPTEPESTQPFKTGLGMWSKYGISLSEEDIDENRADMLRNSIFAADAE
jgi:hypothetical protein